MAALRLTGSGLDIFLLTVSHVLSIALLLDDIDSVCYRVLSHVRLGFHSNVGLDNLVECTVLACSIRLVQTQSDLDSQSTGVSIIWPVP